MNLFAVLLNGLTRDYDDSCVGVCSSTCNGVSRDTGDCKYTCVFGCSGTENEIMDGCAGCGGTCVNNCADICQFGCSYTCEKKSVGK